MLRVSADKNSDCDGHEDRHRYSDQNCISNRNRDEVPDQNPDNCCDGYEDRDSCSDWKLLDLRNSA